MTLALARKYRPRTFTEVVGQEHVVRALTNALTQNRLHHAYLLTGTRGVGKTTLARIIAKALNCETGITATPCGVCGACREIDGGRFVDLIELDAASNTQVDNMRELLENALYAPTSGRYKVYIIDEVHMLSRSAFNAMLKTLEEPPAHVKFILATTDPQKIPVTVLSRCLQFNLRQIPEAQITGQLAKVLGAENIAFEPPALALLARAAQGSMRDSLSLLDQAIAHGAGRVDEASVRAMLGAVDQAFLHRILRAVAARDGAALLAEAATMAERSIGFEAALQDLGSLLHRIALYQAVPQSLPADDPDHAAIAGLAGLFGAEEVQLHYQIVLHGRQDFAHAPDEYAGFTMALLRMLAFAPADGGGTPAARPRPQSAAAASPAATAPARGETAAGADGDWGELVAVLKLGGMARMLAAHCELVKREGSRFELRVPAAHKHLLDKPYQDKLAAALAQHCGGPVKVSITLGETAGNSPAEREARANRERQEQAVAAIEGDPFVRELVENFDGRVIDSTIKPLQ